MARDVMQPESVQFTRSGRAAR